MEPRGVRGCKRDLHDGLVRAEEQQLAAPDDRQTYEDRVPAARALDRSAEKPEQKPLEAAREEGVPPLGDRVERRDALPQVWDPAQALRPNRAHPATGSASANLSNA